MTIRRNYSAQRDISEDEIYTSSRTGDPYDENANSYICWDAKAPVKLRMGKTYPENRPPTLVQTMLRNTVQKYPNTTAVSFKQDDSVIKWTYEVWFYYAQNIIQTLFYFINRQFYGTNSSSSYRNIIKRFKLRLKDLSNLV